MRSPIPHVIVACAFLSAACLSGGGPAAARGLASESMDATERLGQLGADIVARERRLRATRSQLQSQRRAVAGARVRLASSEDKLKRLSFAAQKISREPTPSIFLHPDKPLDAARSAMLLRRLSREIAKSRQEAEEEMERLQTAVGAQERAEALLIADLHALGYLADPHSALAWRALRRSLDEDETGVFLCTAHPAKFAEVIEDAIGLEVLLPPALAEVRDREVLSAVIPPEFGALREEILA